MSKNHESMPITLLDKLHTTGAGYDVIRYIGLPDIFGEESPTLLYFMGKNLSRKLDIQSVSDIVYAFDKLGWGQLELVKEKKNQLIFQLMADSVVYRLTSPLDIEFRLEAGFLSESIEQVKGRSCECQEDLHKKIHQVEFTIIFTD
ncbi:YslB family protein [Lentibacillus sp.]|jgi:predicted hydrocarbon binding protein|uniref:YslB family protein n=1 Tax=Lentibacillus sp. TaxID=1925746 RepID=UPI002B4B866F|nr:YslB family protein [Lentibacillus sp.]HLS10059.1 YslB family protein [Lentibacillus sp.]